MTMDMNHYFLSKVQTEYLRSKAELANFLWFSPFCIFSGTQFFNTIFSASLKKSDRFC